MIGRTIKMNPRVFPLTEFWVPKSHSSGAEFPGEEMTIEISSVHIRPFEWKIKKFGKLS